MQLGYVIHYVPDVAAAVAFYEAAFTLGRRFVHESGQYAEMDTGSTVLAFVEEGFAGETIRFSPARPGLPPPAMEIAFVSMDVDAAYNAAVAAGAIAHVPPLLKPWGQTVAYVRDLNGFLVEICSPMAA